ncbi:methyl-accepting chemotaxis protein [Solirhodobacter olei]|uniref:methyl-accepting chemotaxis protein n=1 Tax=Solirhodobacter olei TaxID=2493082 RepID=UPI000FD98993|nr:methyl-accepting chemotaxis protein [Solirhodobacter olei]
MKKVAIQNSIFGKGALALLFCIGAVSMTLALVNYSSTIQISENVMAQRATEMTQLLSKFAGGPLKFSKPEILRTLMEDTLAGSDALEDYGLAINVDKAVVVGKEGSDTLRASVKALAVAALETRQRQVSADRMTVAYPVFYGPDKSAVGAIATHWDMSQMRARLHNRLMIAIWWSSAVFGVAMLLGAFFLRSHIAAPLGRLGDAIHRIAERDYTTDVPCQTRSDEVGEIGRAVEEMRQRLAESQKAVEEAAYKGAAFQASSAAMMLVDQNLDIVFVNHQMEELFIRMRDQIAVTRPDFDPKRVTGRNIDAFHTQTTHVKRMLSGLGQGLTRAVITLPSSRIQLTASAVKDEAGNQIGAVVEWTDITDVASNDAILRAINSDQARAEFGADGQLESCNARFAEALGSSEEGLAGRGLAELLDPGWRDGKGGNGLMAEVEHGQTHVGRMEFGSDKGKVIFDASFSCVRDHKGNAMKFLLLGRDITAVERRLAESRAERDEMERQQTLAMDTLKIALRHMREGDLSLRVTEPFASEYEELRADYNATVDTLTTTMRELIDAATGIHGEAKDISSTADALSRRTEATAATLEETAAALDQLTSSVQSAAEGAARADRQVTEMRQNAERSGEIVKETVGAMDRISAFSEQIASITKVIEDIAFQTNLLALNAGVEAARAGEAGRGFAVVASEVRALAQRCTEAAREINELIADSGAHVKRGVDLVGETGAALKEIVQSISGIAGLVTEIAESSRSQSTGLAEINAAVTALDQSTQQNAARLEETTAASQSLTDDAMVMVETVSHFQLGGDAPSTKVVALSNRETTPSARRSNSAKGEVDARDRPAAAPPRPKRAASAGPGPQASGDEGWSDY